MKYIKLDGTSFDGPVFHPHMEVAGLEDLETGQLRFYRSLYSRDRVLLYRQELDVDRDGCFIYPEELK